MSEFEQVKELIEKCTVEQRREIFQTLRKQFSIHPLEAELNTQAEIILEAIHKSSDLTLRGIRGVIAQAAFEVNVTVKLTGWRVIPVKGDPPYDSILRDTQGDIKIQVKMQRLKEHRPMMAKEAYKYLSPNMYVVETQRTRGGKNPKTGTDTRPYKFGEFDILAVSLHPSTNDWTTFLYTVQRWLISSDKDASAVLKFQPVPLQPNQDWSSDLLECIRWFRSGDEKTISY